MNDPFSVDEHHVHVDNLSRADVAADVALFLEGEQEIDGLIVEPACCPGCGCTEQDACGPGCWWVPDPHYGRVCSTCRRGAS